MGTTGLIVLLVVIAVGRAALWLAAGFVEIIIRFTMSGLLRRNLLRRHPGPAGRPGAALLHRRDDQPLPR